MWMPDEEISVFTFAQAIARTRFGLAMTTRPTKGESNRTIELVLLVCLGAIVARLLPLLGYPSFL